MKKKRKKVIDLYMEELVEKVQVEMMTLIEVDERWMVESKDLI